MVGKNGSKRENILFMLSATCGSVFFLKMLVELNWITIIFFSFCFSPYLCFSFKKTLINRETVEIWLFLLHILLSIFSLQEFKKFLPYKLNKSFLSNKLHKSFSFSKLNKKVGQLDSHCLLLMIVKKLAQTNQLHSWGQKRNNGIFWKLCTDSKGSSR